MQGACHDGNELLSAAGQKVSVNADDFGHSSAVNNAIVECITSGLATNTTAMANMPGFLEACELARDHRFQERVGVHLNLSEGVPLTDGIKKNRTFCNADGCFSYHRQGVLFSPADRECVVKEVEAQIVRCRKNGLGATFADSHRHVHTNLALFRLFESVLKPLGVRRVRISANMHRVDPVRRVYKYGFKRYLLWKGYETTDHFGDISAFLAMTHAQARAPGTYEIMIHPGYSVQGELIDAIKGYSARPMLERLVREFAVTPF